MSALEWASGVYDAIVHPVAANSAGYIWQAATGTIDPWTKEQLIKEESAALQRAGMEESRARARAEADVTDALQAAGADPQQISGVWRELGELLTLAAIAGVAYVLWKVFTAGPAALTKWREVLGS